MSTHSIKWNLTPTLVIKKRRITISPKQSYLSISSFHRLTNIIRQWPVIEAIPSTKLEEQLQSKLSFTQDMPSTYWFVKRRNPLPLDTKLHQTDYSLHSNNLLLCLQNKFKIIKYFARNFLNSIKKKTPLTDSILLFLNNKQNTWSLEKINKFNNYLVRSRMKVEDLLNKAELDNHPKSPQMLFRLQGRQAEMCFR